MAKTKKPTTGYIAAVGLNVATESGEVRYESGDAIDPTHVDGWMVEDGSVIDLDAPEKVEVEVNVESLDPAVAAEAVEAALDTETGADTGDDA